MTLADEIERQAAEGLVGPVEVSLAFDRQMKRSRELTRWLLTADIVTYGVSALMCRIFDLSYVIALAATLVIWVAGIVWHQRRNSRQLAELKAMSDNARAEYTRTLRSLPPEQASALRERMWKELSEALEKAMDKTR